MWARWGWLHSSCSRSRLVFELGIAQCQCLDLVGVGGDGALELLHFRGVVATERARDDHGEEQKKLQ